MELLKSRKKIARELISTGLHDECKIFLKKIETFTQNAYCQAGITMRLLFITGIFTLTSCATIISTKDYVMSISSDLSNSEVVINNSNVYKLPSKAVVTRSKEDINFKILQNDSIINDTILKPKLSDTFWWGNTGQFFYLAPIAWLVDLNTDKRFTYGEYIFIDSLGNIKSYKTFNKLFSNEFANISFKKYKKGNFNLLLSIPHVNFFHLSPKNESSRNLAGFWGVGLGAEYFYKKNKSLQLYSDAITDIFIPVPAAVDFDEFSPRESSYAFNINLTDNFNIKRFQLGYGLNFAKNTWIYHGYYDKRYEELAENEEPEWINGRTKTNKMLGLVLNTYYRFTNHFYFGVIYRPAFFEMSNSKLMYEHSISFDFMWKIHF